MTSAACVLLFCSLFIAPSSVGQSSSFRNGVPSYTVFEAELIGAREGITSLSIDSLGRLVGTCGSDLIVFDGSYWFSYSRKIDSDGNAESVFTTIVGPDGQTYCSSAQGLHRIKFLANEKYALEPIANAGAQSETTAYNAMRDAFVQNENVYFYGFTQGARIDTARGTVEPDPVERHMSSALIPFDGNLVEHGEGDSIFIHKPDGSYVPVSTRRWEGDTGEIKVSTNWRGSVRFGYDHGLGQYRDGVLRNWPTEIDTLVSRNVSGLVALTDEYIAVSVLSQGIYILDTEGNIVQTLDRSLDHRFGMADNLVSAGNGVLWASLGNSIVRVDFLSPLTKFSAMMPSAVFYPKLFFHEDRLHVVTDGKLHRAEYYDGGALKGFHTILPESQGIILDALSTEEGIIFTNGQGVYLLERDEAPKQIAPLQRVETFVRLRSSPGVVVASGIEGVFLLERSATGWRYTGQSASSSKRAYYSAEAADGSVWIENGLGQVSRVQLEDGSLVVETFGVEDGLSETWINVWSCDNEVYFSSEGDPMLMWDDARGRFVEASHRLRAHLERIAQFTRPGRDALGNYWVPTVAAGHTVLRQTESGELVHDTKTLAALNSEMITRAMPRPDGSVWLVSRQNIYRYDHRFEKEPPSLAPPVVYSIEQSRGGQMLLDLRTKAEKAPIVVPYEENSLTFRFTSPNISSTSPVIHQYCLEGVSNEWITVQRTNTLHLTNMLEGDYLVKIRASYNGFEFSEPTVVAFSVLPPPYRTIWAYLGYAASSILAIVALSQWLRRRANRRNRILQDMYEKAKAADKAKGAFLATISHEMRTPLNAIIGPSQFLLEKDRDDFERTFLTMIKNAGSQLLTFVDDVLEFTSTGMSDRRIREARFNLEELAHEQFATISARAAEKGVALSCHFEPSLPKHWIGDANRLRQVIGNLLNNALKFTDEGGITLTLAASDRDSPHAKLLVSVVDTGIGISKKHRDMVFEPFQQVESSLSRSYEGAGLGLSICKQLVERMGGEIGVESKIGKGSRFWFSLPWRPAPELEDGGRDAESSDEAPDKELKRVLLVDDNEANLAVAKEMLKKINCEVVTARDGREACRIASTTRFDLVLMDIRMPVMDGIKATLDIRLGDGCNRDTPIVALSAFLSSSVKSECQEAGIVQFLSKPITQESLSKTVSIAFETRN